MVAQARDWSDLGRRILGAADARAAAAVRLARDGTVARGDSDGRRGNRGAAGVGATGEVGG